MKIRKILGATIKGAAGISCGIGAFLVSPLGIGGPVGLIPTIGLAFTSGALIKQAITDFKGGSDA